MTTDISSLAPETIALIVILAAWELVWKGIALWRAGRQSDLTWFIVILVVNTAGILPITYLLLTNEKPKKSRSHKRKS